MKRAKRLTKKERRNARGNAAGSGRHIHCIACGRHIDETEFSSSPVKAQYIKCLHGTTFAVCVTCVSQGQELLSEHDRTGQPVRAAGAWH